MTDVKPKKTCKKLKDFLVDCRVEINLGVRRFHWQTLERHAKDLEEAAESFRAFIRDHRSQDIQGVDVIRVKKDVCSHCREPWEPYTDEETGKLFCACCGAEVES
jgi:hypothetical protein